MSKSVTFIHAADLHFGAPFRGLRALSDAWADRLTRAIPEAYDHLVNTAIDRSVDFVVLAGDIFDTARPSFADFMHFLEGLRKLDAAGIPVYMCTGNHDPYTGWQEDFAELPASCHMFPGDRPGFEVFRKDGEPLVVLGGRGYYNQTFDRGVDVAAGITKAAAEAACGEKAPFGVGVIHTGLDQDPNKAPTDPAGLRRSGMDYWALGHIHRTWVDSETDPHIVFSGCIQGRDIKETGPRGCRLVTLREGMPNSAEFIPCAGVVWQRLFIDVSAATGIADIRDIVMRDLFAANGEAACEYMVARITLTGATDVHAVLCGAGVIDDLRASINDYAQFFCDALIDETRMPIDRESLREQGLFPAAVLEGAGRMQRDFDAVAYLDKAFLEHGVELSAGIRRDIHDIENRAVDTVLDALDGRDA